MKKNTAISKIALVGLVAFCLPLVACSKGDGEVLLAGTKAKAGSSWMSGPKEKSSKNKIQIGAKKGKSFSGGGQGGVKVPKIGGVSKKKKGKDV